MSYTLLLVRVPSGASEEDVEKIARAATEAEDTRAPGPVDPETERRKRTLVDALLAECPELEGGEPDYAALARGEKISEAQARERFDWWTVTGAEEGAHIEITLYNDYVSVDLPSASGTAEDWEDVWRYLEILVREGGFVVWDPQGEDLVDLANGPSGDGQRKARPPTPKRRQTRKRNVEDEEEDDDPAVEPEDIRRGGDIAKLINRIINEAIAEPLAAARFKRSGRTWRRALDNGLVHVVDVRWSPRDAGVEGVFSLGAGVYFARLPRVSRCTRQPTLQKSTTARCGCDRARMAAAPGGYGCRALRKPIPTSRGLSDASSDGSIAVRTPRPGTSMQRPRANCARRSSGMRCRPSSA